MEAWHNLVMTSGVCLNSPYNKKSDIWEEFKDDKNFFFFKWIHCYKKAHEMEMFCFMISTAMLGWT